MTEAELKTQLEAEREAHTALNAAHNTLFELYTAKAEDLDKIKNIMKQFMDGDINEHGAFQMLYKMFNMNG
jgi:hypothetical protein